MKKTFSFDTSEGLPALPEGVTQLRGSHDGRGKRIGIAVARFNIGLTGALVSSAVEALLANGVRSEDIAVSWVPGSFELPLALKRLALSGPYDALIALGVVIDGETRHAELILTSISRAFVQLSLELNCPVIDSVVSARTPEQAEARCLTGDLSRGAYAALAALEICSSRKTTP
jgi:6,7-dimethyl-8-ribityllumazine synthase